MSDNVNHPSHYETGKFECIEVMEEVFGKEAVQNFCMCNAFKYLYRCNRKNGSEDLQKAQWYINKYLELLGVNTIHKGEPEVAYNGACEICKYWDKAAIDYPCNECKHNTPDNFVPKEGE